MSFGVICLTTCVLILCALQSECSQPALPETALEPIDSNTTSTCYGLTHFQPSCPVSGTVIAIRELTVGAKLNTSGCPDVVTEIGGTIVDADNTTLAVDALCCRFEDGDCTFEYTSHDQNAQPFKHFRYCSGMNTCSDVAETIWDTTQCPGSYLRQTNYMFAQYYCIDETRIADMCSSTIDETLTGSAFYLESPNYPNNISTGYTNCACSVQSSICEDTINVYTVQVEMTSDGSTCRQRLSVNDSGMLREWDCDSQTMFNITETLTGNYIIVTLDNSLTSDGGYVWLGFKGSNDTADLVINCPPVPENCTRAPPNPGASSGDGGGGGISLGMIIGIIVGLLVLIAILVLCLCCLWCKKKKKNQVEHDDGNKERDPDEKALEDSLGYRARGGPTPPVNIHFPLGAAASLRGHETRYIMEHSGVNGIESTNDPKKRPTRLPPLTNTAVSNHPPPQKLPPLIGIPPPIIPPSKSGAPRIITKPSTNHPLPDYQTQKPKKRPPAVFHPNKDMDEDIIVDENSITARDVHTQPSVHVQGPSNSRDGEDDEVQKKKKKKHRKHKKRSNVQALERGDEVNGEMQQHEEKDDEVHGPVGDGTIRNGQFDSESNV